LARSASQAKLTWMWAKGAGFAELLLVFCEGFKKGSAAVDTSLPQFMLVKTCRHGLRQDDFDGLVHDGEASGEEGISVGSAKDTLPFFSLICAVALGTGGVFLAVFQRSDRSSITMNFISARVVESHTSKAANGFGARPPSMLRRISQRPRAMSFVYSAGMSSRSARAGRRRRSGLVVILRRAG